MHLFISSVNCMAGHFLPCASYAPLSSFLLSSAIPLRPPLLGQGAAVVGGGAEAKAVRASVVERETLPECRKVAATLASPDSNYSSN